MSAKITCQECRRDFKTWAGLRIHQAKEKH